MSENGGGSELLIRSYDYKSKVNMSAPKQPTGQYAGDLARRHEQKRNDITLKF